MVSSVLRSALNQGGWTHTPAHIMYLASHICGRLATRVGYRDLSAHVIPDGDDTLVTELRSQDGRMARLRLVIGRAYPECVAAVYLDTSPHLSFTVPDFPEALHFLGIVLQGLGARTVNVGQRVKERNAELLALPLKEGNALGQIDRCDRTYQFRVREHNVEGSSSCIVRAAETYTPPDMFEWACAHTDRLRRLLRGTVRFHLWARRDNSTWVHRENNGQIVHELAFNAMDETGRSALAVFTEGSSRKLRDYEIEVPNLLHGLHMCGLVMDAMGMPELEIGRRSRERNAEVLAVPFKPYADEGELVNARNLVTTLAHAQ